MAVTSSAARRRRRRRPQATVRRRRFVAVLVLLAVVSMFLGALVAARSSGDEAANAQGIASDAASAEMVLMAGDQVVDRASVTRLWSDDVFDRDVARRWVGRALGTSARVREGRAVIGYRYDRAATVERVAALGSDGGVVRAVRRPVSSSIEAPVFQQAQRNSCESAALAILMATTGRTIDQGRLQRALPTSGEPDPVGSGSQRVWGDPDLGYVGRPDGGGVAGGFGVYPGPVRATAKRFGVRLEDLTGRSPGAVYDRLLQGRAVMVWIGLSDGPYGEWRSPSGKEIRVNFGEHTVVLHGLTEDGLLEVSNPLQGTSERWTKEQFEAKWELLGRRALAP